MATVAPPSDQAADLLQKLSLDPQAKSLEVSEQAKKFVSVDSGDLANGLGKPFERSATHLHQDFVDPNMCYLPNGYPSTYYFAPGYDGQMNEWGDGVEMPPGVYGDIYHHGFGYPYGTYPPPGSPVPTMGHDGQLYGPQHYQYPTPYYQPQAPNGGPYAPSQVTAPQGDVSTSVAPDHVPLSVEAAKGNTNNLVNGGNVNGNNGPKALRPSHQNSSLSSNGSYGRASLPTGVPSSGYQDPRFGFDGTRSLIPSADMFSDGQSKHVASVGFSSPVSHANNFPSGRNQNFRPIPQLMHARAASGLGQASGFMSRMYPNNRMYDQYGNAFRTGSGFGSNGYDSRTSGRGWLTVDSRYRNKSRANSVLGYGNENMDGLNELNRGPRAKGFKNQKGFGPVTLAVRGENLQLNGNNSNSDGNLTLVPDKEQYNREDFPENYSDAKFFIIKSYSEDDVHKSIKYNMWASTANGNKKLDAAYQEAQGKSGSCPIFLLFSVNASGQFVGVAEMVGSVDFNRSLEYWQQDKWTGCFPVKWHVIKDIPNSLLKHITLENNENKPVTNSRDTQEVKFEQGIQVLKIFKNHSSKTTILDDFGFYEARQRTMQEKKAKQQLFQKQVRDVKPTDGVATDDKDRLHPSVDVASSLIKEPTGPVKANGELKALEEIGSAAVADDAPKSAKPDVLSEKRVVPNGVANAC